MKDVMLDTLQRCAEWHAKSAELCRVKAECAKHQKETAEYEKHCRARDGHLAYVDATRWAIKELTTKEKMKKRKAGPANAPDPDEADAYAKEIGMAHLEVSKFLDFYGSKGWKVGKVPMADWKAAMRNWHRSNAPTAQPALGLTDPLGWVAFLQAQGETYKPYRTAPEYLRIKFNDTRK